MTFKRVVITGVGALTPIGNTLPQYWNGLKEGKSGAAPITKFDTTLFKTKFACEVKDLDVNNFMDKKEARKLDPFAQYAIISSDEAIQDANLPQDIDPDRVGVIWGSGIGGLLTFQEEVRNFAAGDGTRNNTPRGRCYLV